MATINSAPRPDQLEQLGNSIPSQPTTSSASTQGNVSIAQGTFHAPSFVNTMSGTVVVSKIQVPPFPKHNLRLVTTLYQSNIAPVAKPSRVRNSPLDVLDWVECFNSYTSIIATFHPHRARDLLAHMALIIRTAKRFGGKAWFHYDRTVT